MSVGALVAPVLGGILYDKAGYRGIFGVASGLLVVDFIMRLLIMEKKTAARYDSLLTDSTANPQSSGVSNDGDEEAQEAAEDDPLMPANGDNPYKIHLKPSSVIRTFPFLYCFRNPRVCTAFFLSFIQATLLGAFDATLPTESQDSFGFTSLQTGLLFIAQEVPYLVLGPVAGWSVDKYGTKPAAVLGFAYLCPVLVLLRLPGEGLASGTANIILYCGILALTGVGFAMISAPSFVEVSQVVEKYDKANPEFFGENGPYGQLYGFSSMFFCAGLTVGPIVGGALRTSIGYGNMNAVFAAVCAMTAILSFFIIGGKPRLLGARQSTEVHDT
jgi:MFS family permease